MNNRPHTVIGVLPPIPEYPAASDVYMPTSQCPFRSSAGAKANREARLMNVFGPLKPGTPLAKAQADLSTVAPSLESSYSDSYPKEDGSSVAAAKLQHVFTRHALVTL